MSEPNAECGVTSAEMPKMENGLIYVCAWCHPRATIFFDHPEWLGLEINHGICTQHHKEVWADFTKEAV